MKKQIILVLVFIVAISFKSFSQASFTIPGNTGCAPLCIIPQDQSTTGFQWHWDFGDGSPTSTSQDPPHCYVNAGVYTVTLIETFGTGTDTATGTVTVYPNPVGAFTFSANGNVVTFTDQSVGASTWLWDFGDSQTSAQQNPVHTYSSAGNYTVSLFVTSNAGCTGSVSHAVTPTGLNEINSSIGWNIFPNPAHGQISVHFDAVSGNEKTLSVENMLGELIFQEKISGDAAIDLSKLSAGIYFVRLDNGPAKKLVIE